MASPLSDIGISLARTHILRILEDARNAEAKLNRQLADDVKPALAPFFFTADQVDAIRSEHAEQVAALKPKSESAWINSEARKAWQDRRNRHPVSATDGPDHEFAIDVIATAARDRSIDDGHLRSIVQMLALVFRPTLGVRLPLDRTLAAKRWIESVPEKPLDRMPRLRMGGHLSAASEEEPESLTPEELRRTMRAVALDRGIAAGAVVPLDREATVKFIRESYDAARRPRGQEE
jgi:hypothetical protein